jgi:hypothetical protein
MTEQGLALFALAFVFFWIVTLDDALRCPYFYGLRSLLVLGYQLMTMEYDRLVITLPEWVANFLVWSHWISVVTVFLYPDPRFRRR